MVSGEIGRIIFPGGMWFPVKGLWCSQRVNENSNRNTTGKKEWESFWVEGICQLAITPPVASPTISWTLQAGRALYSYDVASSLEREIERLKSL